MTPAQFQRRKTWAIAIVLIGEARSLVGKGQETRIMTPELAVEMR